MIRALRKLPVRIVKISATSTAIRPDGPPVGRHHWEVETVLRGSGQPFVILRPNAFMQTFLLRAVLPAFRASGRVVNPIAGAGISMIDARDIGDCAAVALTTSRFDGETLVLTGGEAVTYPRIAAILEQLCGRPVPLEDVTPAEMRVRLVERGMPPWEARALRGNLLHVPPARIGASRRRSRSHDREAAPHRRRLSCRALVHPLAPGAAIMTTPVSPSDDILALEARRTSAMLQADVVALDALMLESCRYVHSSGFIDSKESYLEKLRTGAVRYLRMETSEHHVLPLGETSVVLSLMSFDVNSGGSTRAVRAHAVAVWHRADEGTRLAFFQATVAPPAPRTGSVESPGMNEKRLRLVRVRRGGETRAVLPRRRRCLAPDLRRDARGDGARGGVAPSARRRARRPRPRAGPQVAGRGHPLPRVPAGGRRLHPAQHRLPGERDRLLPLRRGPQDPRRQPRFARADRGLRRRARGAHRRSRRGAVGVGESDALHPPERARGRGGDPLHVGHDRQVQGGRAHARKPVVERAGPRRGLAVAGRRPAAARAPHLPRPRALRRAALRLARRLAHPVSRPLRRRRGDARPRARHGVHGRPHAATPACSPSPPSTRPPAPTSASSSAAPPRSSTRPSRRSGGAPGTPSSSATG